MTAPTRHLTPTQYRQLLASEDARAHRSSTRQRMVFYLPRRFAWMTASAGRGGRVTVRFYPRCPCEAA